MRALLVMYTAAFVLLALLFVATGHCQTTILMPAPKIQFFDVNGKPLAGGQVFTYQAGTSIGQATYTDSTGTVVNTNPIVLDSGGFPSSPLGPGNQAGIYFINGASYRICVFNASSVQQYCVDNVKLVNSAQVGGLNTQVQYNCAGAFCGNVGFTFNAGSQTLSVTAINVSGGGTLNGTFAGNPTFSGTVTVTGSLVVSGTFSVTSLASACTPTASVGFIRMCTTDIVAWRNAINTADYTLDEEPSQGAMRVGFIGGIVMTGANGRLRLGGITNAFPMWKPSGTSIQARLADDTAFTNVTAQSLTYDPTGVTISGPCSTGQVLTAASPSSVTCAAAPPGVLLHANTTTIVNATVGNSNTIVFSRAVTMPLTGCPCRVFASYDLRWTTGGSGVQSADVFDGTNTWAGSVSNETGGVSTIGVGQTGSGFSPVTYANGANVTFTVVAASTVAGSATANGGVGTAQTGTPASQLSLDVFASN